MTQFTHTGDFDLGGIEDDGEELAVPLPYRDQPYESFDREELELINRDQLVTRTDRLLFRAPPVRPSRIARGSGPNMIPPMRKVLAAPTTPERVQSRMRLMMKLVFGLSVVVATIAIYV